MLPNDIHGALRLSMAEGWNQTENDWRLFVENPSNTCLVAECNNNLVGTTAAINYGNTAAWIGMALVDKAYRGLGISKSLLSHTLQKLTAFQSIKLDATAAGEPVYEKFGFRKEYIIARMVNASLQPVIHDHEGALTESVGVHDIDEIIALDEAAFGTNRKQLIEFLVSNNPRAARILRVNGRIVGFALCRSGSKYFHIGPLIARNVAEAKMLLTATLSTPRNEAAIVDVLDDKNEFIEWLHAIGFNLQRQFIRMYKKRNPFPGETKHVYLICGPEFG